MKHIQNSSTCPGHLAYCRAQYLQEQLANQIILVKKKKKKQEQIILE
jgi:hypothetical protein